MAAGFQERAVLVALAADLPVDMTPTYTPWPTETPLPTPTFTPTATPTNTPIPTATFTPMPDRHAGAADQHACADHARRSGRLHVQPRPRPWPPLRSRQQHGAVAAKPSVQFSLVEMRRLSALREPGQCTTSSSRWWTAAAIRSTA